MSLTTPEKIRSLQRKLYCKAKAARLPLLSALRQDLPRRHLIARLSACWRECGCARCRRGDVCCNRRVGPRSVADGLARGLGLEEVQARSGAVGDDPKANGDGERPLGIPTIRDRVVQTAAKMVLEPIFEADFEDTAYGYRPRRGAIDAVKEVHRQLVRGNTDVVDADLSRYFDSIPHSDLLKSVARRIVDRTCCASSRCGSRHQSRSATRTGPGA